jgi:DNA-3-methyladenine glycosylase
VTTIDVPTWSLLPTDPVEAAKTLLGWTLVSTVDGETASVKLTEVEAYAGSSDPASHAYNGETKRNRTMFLGRGHLYVYLSYGIHHLANVVVGKPGVPGAVLLRGGDPVEGIDVMRKRRGRDDDLTSGPGKLGEALGLTLAHDGVVIDDGPIALIPGTPSEHIRATPRIGISKAIERPWRFIIDGP